MIMSEAESPLAFLDRLLDEERKGNAHFGDVRFWKHLEYINTLNVYRTTSLEFRNMKLMFYEAIFYGLYLFFLTMLVLQIRSPDLYKIRSHQLNYWGNCDDNGNFCSVNEVTDTDSCMAWLRTVFAPLAFQDSDYYPSVAMSTSIFRLQAGTTQWQPHWVGDTKASVLVGGIRIRQLRTQVNKGCSIPSKLQSVRTNCYGPFDEAYQSKLTWAPVSTPAYLQQHYTWLADNMTMCRPMAGRHGTYPGSGFVIDLPNNISGAQTRLKELQNWAWLDVRSRAVIVEINTFNPNVNLFTNARIIFEFPATGGCIVRLEGDAFKAIQLSLQLSASDDVSGSFTYLVLTCAFHVMLLVYCIFLLYRNGTRYFRYFWTYFDIGILVTFFVMFFINMYIFSAFNSMPQMQPEVISDPEMFYPIGQMVPSISLSQEIMSWMSLLAWIKILKYLSLIPTFYPFVRVIERCILNLLLFAGLLVIVLFGFAAPLYLAYGDETNLFATLWGSFVAVITAPTGGVDLSPIFNSRDTLGPLLIFAYIVIVILLLLNTFMAICIDTYSVISYEISEVTRNGLQSPSAAFLWTYFNALKGVKLVGKEMPEDAGKDSEQTIPLSSLPEAIAVRYIAMKQRMETILNTAHADIEAQKQQKHQAPEPQEVPGAPSLRDKLDNSSQAVANTSKLMLQDAQSSQLSNSNANTSNRPQNDASRSLGGLGAAAFEENVAGVVVKRVQIQRMLDEDPVLREICSTRRSIDVVRRFHVDQSGADPFQAVAALQVAVAQKLQQMEQKGVGLSFDEMETLRTMSQELHSALTESQKDWRAELLSVLQISSLLSHTLIDLTRKMEQVQINHSDLSLKAKS